MGYSAEVYAAANRTLEQRREASKETLRRRRIEIERRLPEVKKLEDELAQTAIAVTRAVIASSDKGLLEGLRLRGEQVLEQKAQLLRAAGYPADYLEEKHVCERCQDRGTVNGRRCACMDAALREAAADALDAVSGTGRVRFADFSLDYYPVERDARSGASPRLMMERLLAYCRQYAEDFRPGAENLFFTGGPGLGKTYLSLALAYAISDKGHGVIYGSAADLLGAIEREHFERGNDRAMLDRLLAVDFLILDDVGAEFSNNFTVSALFNLVNTRIQRSLPTLISSNLTLKSAAERYGERFVSRLVGCYKIQGFLGQDIRQQKAAAAKPARA